MHFKNANARPPGTGRYAQVILLAVTFPSVIAVLKIYTAALVPSRNPFFEFYQPSLPFLKKALAILFSMASCWDDVCRCSERLDIYLRSTGRGSALFESPLQCPTTRISTVSLPSRRFGIRYRNASVRMQIRITFRPPSRSFIGLTFRWVNW